MSTQNSAGKRPATAEELASRPVRFAIVGTGGMGGTHARNLAGSPEAEVTWLVDVDLDRATKLQEEIGGRVTADMDEAFSSEDVDVALIALPTGLHRMGVEAAAKHGVHVFCEKPIARTNEDAKAMTKACKDAGVTMMVGHVVRFFSEYMRVKEQLDAGSDDADYLTARIVTARFYAEQLLPQVAGLAGAVRAGAGDLYALSPDQLASR